MARVKAEQPLVPSILDRLIDDDPDLKREAPKQRNQILREVKEAVRRDLESLLNTRARCLPYPAQLEELKQSLVNYGIPDFTGANLGAMRDREEFCKSVEQLIRQYETRFKSVKVRPLTNTESMDRTMRFRIDALLRVDPAPEPVVFDSTLRPASGDFEVQGVSE